jgi:hypothetical protein
MGVKHGVGQGTTGGWQRGKIRGMAGPWHDARASVAEDRARRGMAVWREKAWRAMT